MSSNIYKDQDHCYKTYAGMIYDCFHITAEDKSKALRCRRLVFVINHKTLKQAEDKGRKEGEKAKGREKLVPLASSLPGPYILSTSISLNPR